MTSSIQPKGYIRVFLQYSSLLLMVMVVIAALIVGPICMERPPEAIDKRAVIGGECIVYSKNEMLDCE